MILTYNLLGGLVGLVIVLITTAFFYIYRRLTYFKRHNVPHEEPKFLTGNMSGNYHTDLNRLYNKFKNDPNNFFGIYILFNPTIVVTDLDLIKNILIKDFNYFSERGVFTNKRDDPLSNHLFNMETDGWKLQRAKLSPTFTSGKMKYMFPTVLKIAQRLTDVIDDVISKSKSNEIEIKEFLARFGTDVIGNVAFGIECNSLEHPNAEFRKYGKLSVDALASNVVVRILKSNFQSIARLLRLRNQPADVSNFFVQIVKETMAVRSLNNTKRNDFMQLLLEMKKTKDNPDGLEFDQILGHAFVFFLAGFETTSTTMGFGLYELALNEKIQNRARDEINTVLKKHNGELTYEALDEMVYLEQIINESLRKFSPAFQLNRLAVKTYPIPNTNKVIEKGMTIIIPVNAIHNDPDIYPNPETFDPDRFEQELFKERNPLTFLSFGDGPRNCIGLRFGRMQAKLGLAVLLKKFHFSRGDKLEVPISINQNSTIIQSNTGIWLKTKKM